MADKRPTIWCLFQVENNYDQPDNDLAAWWQEKPSVEKLAAYLAHPLDEANSEHIAVVVDIWRGTPGKFSEQGTLYRLEQVEGKD